MAARELRCLKLLCKPGCRRRLADPPLQCDIRVGAYRESREIHCLEVFRNTVSSDKLYKHGSRYTSLICLTGSSTVSNKLRHVDLRRMTYDTSESSLSCQPNSAVNIFSSPPFRGERRVVSIYVAAMANECLC